MTPICQVGKVTFGKGMPKICVPIVARDKMELEMAAEALRTVPCDVVEWRADYYPILTSREQTEDAFAILRKYLPDRLLLFTFRSRSEGGEKPVTADTYLEINEMVLRYGQPDLIDVELSAGDLIVKRLLEKSHESNVKVIVSSHNFKKTPPVIDMVNTLRKMQEMGADLCKLAVMPNSRNDVLALMQATNDMYTHYATSPLITMSMGAYGTVSRIAGETFGSCMTFGCVGKASAPGQMDALNLSMILQILHV